MWFEDQYKALAQARKDAEDVQIASHIVRDMLKRGGYGTYFHKEFTKIENDEIVVSVPHDQKTGFRFGDMCNMKYDYFAKENGDEVFACEVNGERVQFVIDSSQITVQTHDDRAGIPSNCYMQRVASALYQFSKTANDPNDASLAFEYYQYICAVDMEWSSLHHVDKHFERIVCAALDSYEPEEPGDHVEVDIAKAVLAEVVDGYKPVYGLSICNVWESKTPPTDSHVTWM